MDFVRSKLGGFVPRVLAWDATDNNPIGSEYIIMERFPGEELSRRIDDASGNLGIATTLAKVQHELSVLKFSQHGSIFYKEDVDESQRQFSLYADGVPSDHCSERFRIGPSVDPIFYRGGRAKLDISRGPCECTANHVDHSFH